MKRFLTALAFLLCSLCTFSGYSQPMSLFLELPPGVRVDKEGERLQCYNLNSMKILYQLAIDFTFCAEQAKKQGDLINDYGLSIENLKDQLAALRNISEILRKDRDRLFEKWKRENELRHKAENEIPWTTWASWGAAGAATVTAVILTTVLLSKR